MIFTLSEEARKVSESIVGLPCEKIMSTPIRKFVEEKKSISKSRFRQIKPRGSLYLQLGRKASIGKYKKVIENF